MTALVESGHSAFDYREFTAECPQHTRWLPLSYYRSKGLLPTLSSHLEGGLTLASPIVFFDIAGLDNEALGSFYSPSLNERKRFRTQVHVFV